MELARALGDPLRWRIVELLASEQLCVAHLADELQAAQPLVSHHLKVLREAGLVETDRYRVGASYSAKSCGLRILMDQPTESISSHDPPSRHGDS